MKKLLKLFIIGIMCFTLVGCGGKPDGMSDDTYNIGCKVLETVDAYIDADITKDEAYEKINELNDRFDKFEDMSNKDSSVETSCSVVEAALRHSSQTLDDIKNARDELADDLGK